MVGVGDGPFDRMLEYDDRLPSRRFDNFQFVDFHSATGMFSGSSGSSSSKRGNSTKVAKNNSATAFALHAMMEVPDQYRAMRKLGYV